MLVKFLKNATPFLKGDVIDIEDKYAKNHLRYQEAEIADAKDKATITVLQAVDRMQKANKAKAQELAKKAERIEINK